MNMRKPEEFLRCLGYFGFGGGWAMTADSFYHGKKGEMYCNACPVAKACWDKHRERVKKLYPAMVERFEELIAEHKGNGQAAAYAMIREYGIEPYMAVMMGNVEDGASVGAGELPKDRGDATLPYPFDAASQS